jgi:hypothetical protein
MPKILEFSIPEGKDPDTLTMELGEPCSIDLLDRTISLSVEERRIGTTKDIAKQLGFELKRERNPNIRGG